MAPSPLSGLAFCVITFGCQMNKHDSERVVGMLEALGGQEVAEIADADAVIFMTCCVREAADVRLKGQASSLKSLPLREGTQLPKRLVAIGGCIGQRDGEALVREMPHVDVVFGTHNLASLPLLLDQAIESGRSQVEVLEEGEGFPTDLPTERERAWAAWLPITIGCDNFCSYCIVPHVRGRERSRPLEEVAQEAKRYVAEGVKEITLLGQNVNSYGRDLYGEPRFAAMLDAVDAAGVERLRFATSHPKDLTDEVIDRFGSLRSLQPALHLPVQSGSDRILEAMNRRYDVKRYLSLVERLRAVRPDIALSTDVIVGFPGETEDDFEATYRLIEQVGYNQVFTFIYSKREGTPAAQLPDDTPREVVQERFDRLVDLVQRRSYELNQPYVGRVLPVLFEGASKRDATLLAGKDPYGGTVHAPSPKGLSPAECAGRIMDVRIDQARTWYLRGEVIGADG